MKIKTSDLKGAALDWAVRHALNGRPPIDYVPNRDNFSTYWNKGGPIIEREKIKVGVIDDDPACAIWAAQLSDPWRKLPNVFSRTGPTPLIAAMRCFCASKLGEFVEVPDELL